MRGSRERSVGHYVGHYKVTQAGSSWYAHIIIWICSYDYILHGDGDGHTFPASAVMPVPLSPSVDSALAEGRAAARCAMHALVESPEFAVYRGERK